MKKIFVCVLGLVLLLGACQRDKAPREKGNVTVKTATVESHEDRLSIEYPGKVLAASDVSFTMAMREFPSVGKAVRKACGRTMCRITCR